MTKIAQVSQFLNQFAPTRLAEEWDNVGLLVGDPKLVVERMMTCLTVTPPLKRITTETVASKLIWDLIRAGVSIYSPHTGFDSAVSGINQSLSQRLGIVDATPIKPILDDHPRGRWGISLIRSKPILNYKQFAPWEPPSIRSTKSRWLVAVVVRFCRLRSEPVAIRL